MSTTKLYCLECGERFNLDLLDKNAEHECPGCGGVDLDFDERNSEHDEEHDQFNSDAEADADVLRSAGWGTDEDYGYYGDDSF